MEMHGMCQTVTGLLVGLAGLGMAGVIPNYAGWLFVLVGLAILVHGLGMCPQCKVPGKK